MDSSSIPIKGNTFQRLDKLFHYKVAVSPIIVACLNEVRDMLFWIAFPIELLELGGLVIVGHPKSISPLSVRLGV